MDDFCSQIDRSIFSATGLRPWVDTAQAATAPAISTLRVAGFGAKRFFCTGRGNGWPSQPMYTGKTNVSMENGPFEDVFPCISYWTWEYSSNRYVRLAEGKVSQSLGCLPKKRDPGHGESEVFTRAWDKVGLASYKLQCVCTVCKAGKEHWSNCIAMRRGKRFESQINVWTSKKGY